MILETLVIIVGVVGVLLMLGWVGLQIQPRSFAPFPAGKSAIRTIPLPAGLPAGGYYITLAVYDSREPSGLDIMDVAGNPAGKRVRLGPLN